MLFALVSFVSCEPVVLTNENFTSFISNSSRPVFLKLWATWCPHCKEFAPVWDELRTLEEFYETVYVADIECESNRKSCKTYEGKNYPQLYWIEPFNQSMTTYTGERSLEHFKLFIKKQLNFPMVLVEENEIPLYSQTANVTTVFVFQIPKDDKAGLVVAQNVSSSLRNFECRFLLHFVNDGEKSLIAYTEIGRQEKYSGDWNDDDLRQFIVLRSLPFLVTIDSFVMHHLSDRRLKTFVILSNESREFTQETLNIAERMSQYLPVTRTDCVRAPWFCRYLDVPFDKWTVSYVIYDRRRRLFWVDNEENQSEDDVFGWSQRVLRGEVAAKGPGDGPFSSIIAAYYDQKGRGDPTFVIFIGPLIAMVAIVFLIYDLCCESGKSDKKRKKGE